MSLTPGDLERDFQTIVNYKESSFTSDEHDVLRGLIGFYFQPFDDSRDAIRMACPNRDSGILEEFGTTYDGIAPTGATTVSVLVDPATMITKYQRPTVVIEESGGGVTPVSINFSFGPEPDVLDSASICAFAVQLTLIVSSLTSSGGMTGAVFPRLSGNSVLDLPFSTIPEMTVQKSRMTRTVTKSGDEGIKMELTMVFPMRNPSNVEPIGVVSTNQVTQRQFTPIFSSHSPELGAAFVGTGWPGANPFIVGSVSSAPSDMTVWDSATYTGSEAVLFPDTLSVETSVVLQLGLVAGSGPVATSYYGTGTIKIFLYALDGTSEVFESHVPILGRVGEVGAVHKQVMGTFNRTITAKSRITRIRVTLRADKYPTQTVDFQLNAIAGDVTFGSVTGLSFDFGSSLGTFKLKSAGSAVLEYAIRARALCVNTYTRGVRPGTTGLAPRLVNAANLDVLIGTMNSSFTRVLTEPESLLLMLKYREKHVAAGAIGALVSRVKSLIDPFVSPAIDAVGLAQSFSNPATRAMLAGIPGGAQIGAILDRLPPAADLQRGWDSLNRPPRGRLTASSFHSARFPVVHSDTGNVEVRTVTVAPGISPGADVYVTPSGTAFGLVNFDSVSDGFLSLLDAACLKPSTFSTSGPVVGASWEPAAACALAGRDCLTTGVFLDDFDGSSITIEQPYDLDLKSAAVPDLVTFFGPFDIAGLCP
jgi:hypothetical protein